MEWLEWKVFQLIRVSRSVEFIYPLNSFRQALEILLNRLHHVHKTDWESKRSGQTLKLVDEEFVMERLHFFYLYFLLWDGSKTEISEMLPLWLAMADFMNMNALYVYYDDYLKLFNFFSFHFI